MEILARVLPPAPAVLFDIGGAAGAYAFPLSEQGYLVHLIDPVEVHLEQARARSKSSGITLGSITKGDARRLREASFADIQLFAVEGPVWSTAHLGEAWDDPVQRKSLMEFLALIEREPSAHGASLWQWLTQPDSSRCQARS